MSAAVRDVNSGIEKRRHPRADVRLPLRYRDPTSHPSPARSAQIGEDLVGGSVTVVVVPIADLGYGLYAAFADAEDVVVPTNLHSGPAGPHV